MRLILASALALLACGCSERTAATADAGAPAVIPAGPDPIVIRVPRDGGRLAAWAYPALDSLVWRASQGAPALVQVLAADLDDGYLAAVDTAGRPVRIDLRLGAVAIPGAAGGRLHASADGAVIYALNVEGQIARYTPIGDRWAFTPSAPPAALLPARDGGLIIAATDADRTTLRRVRPPDSLVTDSIVIDAPADPAVLSASARLRGDRIFLAVGERVVSVRTRDFVLDLDVDLGEPIRLLTATPSGDRLFAHVGDESALRIVDRFAGDEAGRITLPAVPGALRVDPLGRTLLARLGAGDEVVVIDLGTSQVVGTLASEWRGDLPLVLADGRVATLAGRDVQLVLPTAPDAPTRIDGGGRETWYAMRWNGFRPRAAGLDAPRRFPSIGTGENAPPPVAGVPGGVVRDSTGGAPPGDSTASGGEGAPAAAPPARTGGFTVQFAAVLSEQDARDAAQGLTVEGRSARIVTSVRDGRTLWRVVLGPFDSRAEAERIGQASGRSYWVFEGQP